MAFDWDADLLGPVMGVFGEGKSDDPSSWPTFYPASGAAFQLPGAVFDEQYQRIYTLESGASVSSTHPVLGVRDSLFAADPLQGDGVLIPKTGKTYRVTDVQADGHGHTLLLLSETGL